MSSQKYNRERTLLTLLSDGRFHSGQSLGETLGITRSAVWKKIQALQKRGIDIQSIRGKGYRIPNGLCFLDKTKILERLNKDVRQALNQLDCFDIVESTNDYLLNQTRAGQPKVVACFAEQQTAGRGRCGREWLSPYANNIYHSILWYFNKDPSELVGLSLAIAVSVTRTLKALGIKQGLELKWPNDILWHGQKLCGILIEMLAEPNQQCALVIGIGINTRLTTQQRLKRPITSTEDILNRPTDRNQLAAMIVNELIPTLKEFQQSGLKNFLYEWQTMDSFAGRMVRLTSPQQQIVGRMQGISERGELLLENTQGHITTYLNGELSLQKLDT